MEESNETQPISTNAVSSDTRGGPWLPVVLAAIGVGVVLSGIFSEQRVSMVMSEQSH